MTTEELQFLFESNKIESVYDADSLMQAIYAWEYLKSQTKMTSGVIKKTHKILMLNQPLLPNEKGYFKTVNVTVGGKATIDCSKIPEVIDDWCNETMKRRHSAKNLHIEYERIHPFRDGNGRSGRLLLLWTWRKKSQPVQIIYEKDKYEYYDWFR